MTNVCPVCVMREILVGGQHISSVGENAVHAWCSNHEDITNSENLVCNYGIENHVHGSVCF